MKKAVAAVSALVVAGVCVAPGIVGGVVKNRLDNLLANLSQTPEVESSWVSYDKGWFGAEGVINTRITLTDVPGEEPFTFDIQSNVSINHGPVILGNGVQFAWASWQSDVETTEAIKSALSFDGESIYNQSGRINFLGHIELKETAPAFTYEDETSKVVFSGYQAEGEVKGNNIQYQGAVEKVTVTASAVPVPVEFNKLAVVLDGELPDQGFQSGKLYPGEFSMTAGGIYAGQLFLADDLAVAVDLVLNENASTADITTRYSASRIQTTDMMLTNAGLDLTLANYSEAFSKAYMEQVQEQLLAADSEELAQQLMMDFLQNNVGTLLETKPELDISSVRFTLPEGTFSSRFGLKLADYNASIEQLSDPLFWRSNLIVDAYADADKQLANKLATWAAIDSINSNENFAGYSRSEKADLGKQQAEMMLNMLTAGGMLAVKDDKLVAELSMKNGETIVNGKAMPLPY